MKNMNFDLNEWIGNVNNSMIQSNEYFNGMAKAIDVIKKDGIDTISEEVGALKRTVSKLSNDISMIKDENNGIKEDLEEANKTINKLKDKTDILEFEDKKTLGEIKKQSKLRLINLLGGTSTPQYILFFRTCISDLYGKINDSLTGGKSLGKIKTEDGQGAITIARRYQLNKRAIINKYHEYQKQEDKGILEKEKIKALELVEEWMEELI